MKRTEKEEIKRDRAKAVKNSGRGLKKGDASLHKFLVDYKHNEKTFTLTLKAWAKMRKDAFNANYKYPCISVELMKNAVDNFDTQCDFYYKQAPKVIKEYNWQNQCDKVIKSLIKRVGVDMFSPVGKAARNKYIYFQSGTGYSTDSGVKFSRDEPMQKVSEDEYTSLIRNSNFREPTNEEIIKHLQR